MSLLTPGPIVILTAPSGSGKTSITRHLLARHPDKLAFSISAATRAARGAEKHGVDYYFLSVEAFKNHIQQEDFVEWEMVYEGKYYGTLKEELQRIWNAGKAPVLDIDVKGAIHVQQQYPDQTLSLFILPPSVQELERRLRSRGTEDEEALQARLAKAAYELSFSHSFSYVVVNESLDAACREAEALVVRFLSGRTEWDSSLPMVEGGYQKA